MRAQGADIVCVPTNWVPIPGQDPKREAMANILCMAAAHSNSIFVAAADRVGTERGQPFIGQSLIVSYTGWPIGRPASYDREEIVYAEANLADARRKRNWNEYNQVLRDRRSDVYAEMLGADAPRAGTEAARSGRSRGRQQGEAIDETHLSRPTITRRTALHTIGATTALATARSQPPRSSGGHRRKIRSASA